MPRAGAFVCAACAVTQVGVPRGVRVAPGKGGTRLPGTTIGRSQPLPLTERAKSSWLCWNSVAVLWKSMQ